MTAAVTTCIIARCGGPTLYAGLVEAYCMLSIENDDTRLSMVDDTGLEPVTLRM